MHAAAPLARGLREQYGEPVEQRAGRPQQREPEEHPEDARDGLGGHGPRCRDGPPLGRLFRRPPREGLERRARALGLARLPGRGEAPRLGVEVVRAEAVEQREDAEGEPPEPPQQPAEGELRERERRHRRGEHRQDAGGPVPHAAAEARAPPAEVGGEPARLAQALQVGEEALEHERGDDGEQRHGGTVSGLAPSRASAAPSRAQSKAGPGSVLRPGATWQWPTTRRGVMAG